MPNCSAKGCFIGYPYLRRVAGRPEVVGAEVVRSGAVFWAGQSGVCFYNAGAWWSSQLWGARHIRRVLSFLK